MERTTAGWESVRSAPLPGNEPPNVLVVDDSRTARQTLVAALKRAELNTIEASDGIQALQLLRQNEVMAVFSDIEMPHLSGMDLLRQIRESEDWSELPVFIVSSRDEDACRQETKRRGATAHMAKPVSAELIAKVASRLLRKKGTVVGQQTASEES
jgi:CheY-like chemotaxis protein